MKQKIIAMLIAIAITVFGVLMTISPAFAQTSAANASSLDISKLTPEQKAALISQAAALEKEAKSSTNISQAVRTEAVAWGELGTNMGRAAVSAAKELGVAANEFVQTPLGKITMGIVIFKVMGQEILGVFFGSVVLIFFFSLALYIAMKDKYKTATLERVPVLWGLYHRKVVTTYEIDEDLVSGHWIASGVLLVVGMVVGLPIIF